MDVQDWKHRVRSLRISVAQLDSDAAALEAKAAQLRKTERYERAKLLAAEERLLDALHQQGPTS